MDESRKELILNLLVKTSLILLVASIVADDLTTYVGLNLPTKIEIADGVTYYISIVESNHFVAPYAGTFVMFFIELGWILISWGIPYILYRFKSIFVSTFAATITFASIRFYCAIHNYILIGGW